MLALLLLMLLRRLRQAALLLLRAIESVEVGYDSGPAQRSMPHAVVAQINHLKQLLDGEPLVNDGLGHFAMVSAEPKGFRLVLPGC